MPWREIHWRVFSVFPVVAAALLSWIEYVQPFAWQPPPSDLWQVCAEPVRVPWREEPRATLVATPAAKPALTPEQKEEAFWAAERSAAAFPLPPADDGGDPFTKAERRTQAVISRWCSAGLSYAAGGEVIHCAIPDSDDWNALEPVFLGAWAGYGPLDFWAKRPKRPKRPIDIYTPRFDGIDALEEPS